jgi:heme exporter protein A
VHPRQTPSPPAHPPAGAASNEPAIELVEVTRVFGAVAGAVRVSLSLPRGEVLLIRGPNGAGKSTLLRLIATAITPTYGGGRVLGFDIARQREEVRRRVELSGHRTRLYEDLSARENLAFVCSMHGLARGEIDAALERVGLADAAGDRVHGFSQGMRQRLSLGRVVLRAPELLLLDEPYSGLDAEAGHMVDELVLEARRQGRTVVLATHDPTRAHLATSTARMEDGRLGEVAPRPGDLSAVIDATREEALA